MLKMSTAAEPKKLNGEGDIERIVRVRVRKYCEVCREEPATMKQTFLLAGTRNNPASSAYGKDDCSWCEDESLFTCDSCITMDVPEGYVSCARFGCGDLFAHLFLEWEETKELVPAVKGELG